MQPLVSLCFLNADVKGIHHHVCCPLHSPSKILSYVLNNGIYLGVLFFLNRLTKKLEERREEKRKEEEQVELTLSIGSLCYLKEFLICCPIQQTQSDILRAQCCIVVEEMICSLHSVCTIYIHFRILVIVCFSVCHDCYAIYTGPEIIGLQGVTMAICLFSFFINYQQQLNNLFFFHSVDGSFQIKYLQEVDLKLLDLRKIKFVDILLSFLSNCILVYSSSFSQ